MGSKVNITLRIPVEDLAELLEASLATRGPGYKLGTIVRIALLEHCETLRTSRSLPSWTESTAEAFLCEQNMMKGGKKDQSPLTIIKNKGE